MDPSVGGAFDGARGGKYVLVDGLRTGVIGGGKNLDRIWVVVHSNNDAKKLVLEHPVNSFTVMHDPVCILFMIYCVSFINYMYRFGPKMVVGKCWLNSKEVK